KALVYLDEPLKHRLLVVQEADGLTGAEDVLRPLLTEGELNHYVTESQPDGSRVTVRYHKEGPTALLTTSVQPLFEEQLESRLWSIWIEATPPRTAQVKGAIAKRYRTATDPRPDVTAQQAAQLWLEGYGTTKVNIAFGQVLAERTPNHPVTVVRQ